MRSIVARCAAMPKCSLLMRRESLYAPNVFLNENAKWTKEIGKMAKGLNMFCNKQTWANDEYRNAYDEVEWPEHPKDCNCARCFTERMDRSEKET